MCVETKESRYIYNLKTNDHRQTKLKNKWQHSVSIKWLVNFWKLLVQNFCCLCWHQSVFFFPISLTAKGSYSTQHKTVDDELRRTTRNDTSPRWIFTSLNPPHVLNNRSRKISIWDSLYTHIFYFSKDIFTKQSIRTISLSWNAHIFPFHARSHWNLYEEVLITLYPSSLVFDWQVH